ncbi:hypothetical protein MMC30_000271 [Trapelia coarctata]|nr:hypothetical protein [Trapelia coarctata]
MNLDHHELELATQAAASQAATNDSVTVPIHPLGVRPAGNAYTATENFKSAAGSFSYLPDELLVYILEFLDAKALVGLGSTCRALYAFSRLEDLWKTFFILSPPPSFTWRGTWYSTFAGTPKSVRGRISCKNLFSDVLHRPFLCAHTALGAFTENIPAVNCIERLPNLSASEFPRLWTNKPFILTDPVKEWPVYQGWSLEALLEKYSEIDFRAETVDWPLRKYVEYMNDTADESPLYLFDRSFVEKMKLSVGKSGDYWIPDCFGEDLFAALNDQRPDSRWLIVGPERSGSTFHKDPNATSAWNAVIRGSKYWIMFPTSPSYPPPPGVFVSEDQSEVTSPLSIAEWLLGFHTEARNTPGCMEGICHAGEVLHVPSGWWHLVINLSPSIALTQNFVPQAHLANVLAFLKDKPDQVSGFQKDVADPYGLFVQKLQEQHPDLLAEAQKELASKKDGRKRKWIELVNGHEQQEQENGESRGFSFGFAEEEDSDRYDISLTVDTSHCGA